MIYRAKLGLQNTKQLGSYSPMHSPSNSRKASALKQHKFSPKPNRQSKENQEQRESKTDRVKDEKYFKLPKQDTSSSKKPKPNKISLSISFNDNKKNVQQFDDLNLLNIETPKFKCSSNKIDDRAKTQNFNQHQNYFSFGEDFRENIKLNGKMIDQMGQTNQSGHNREKKGISPLKERNKNVEQDQTNFQKFTIDSVKKKQKGEKIRQGEQKLEQRLIMLEKQIKESKLKKDREIFGFKK